MRAITLWRPWDQAILHGGKFVENRPWALWPKMIGQTILLHGGKRYDKEGALFMLDRKLYVPPSPAASPTGIVGAFVVDRVINEGSFDDPAFNSAWFFGPFGWVISKVMAFDEVIECRGKQGLWRPDPADETRALHLITSGVWKDAKVNLEQIGIKRERRPAGDPF